MNEKQFTFDRDTVAPNIKLPIVFKEGERLNIGEVLDKLNELNDENRKLDSENTNLIISNKELKCTNIELAKKNEQLKNLAKRQQKSNEECSKYIEEVAKENKKLKEHDELFFKQVFDILLKYQDLFNREMADEVLEELGIELTRWFE